MRKYLYKAITLTLIMNMMILSVSCGKVGEMRSAIKFNDGYLIKTLSEEDSDDEL